MFPPLSAFLQERRHALNEQFARLHSRFPRLERETGFELICTVVDPLWQAVSDRETEGAVCQAAQIWYEFGLELAGKGFLPTGHTPQFWTALPRLAKAFPMLAVRQSRSFMAGIANALWQMQSLGKSAIEAWITTLERIDGTGLDLTTWMQAGTVTAWRCGMAVQRKRALSDARALAPEIGRICLGLSRKIDSTQWSQLIDKLTGDPWYDPESETSRKQDAPILIGSVGSYRGMGGEFARPPRVQNCSGMIVAGVERDWFVVHADVFGSGLQRISTEPAHDASALPEPWQLMGGGVVVRQGKQSVIPELGQCVTAAANDFLLVATLHHSHRLFLVA